MIDLYVPQGILAKHALTALADSIVAAVNLEEGYAAGRFVGSISWTYVHELPAGQLRVGNEPCRSPVWRVEIATPAGSLETAAKARLGEQIARLVLGAAGEEYDAASAGRVWCLFRNVRPGDWYAGERAATVTGIRAAITREAERTLSMTIRD